MPQPLRKSIRLVFNPSGVVQRPELCAKIVAIGSVWSIIEDSLAVTFAHVTEIEPAVAAAILNAAPSVFTRLQMLETAIDSLVSDEALASFRALMPEIRKRANERNTLMHADWRVHNAYPGALIRRRQIGNPTGRADVYQLGDFEAIERRMDRLMLDVQEFERSIEGDWFPKDPERRKSYWQLVTRVGDPLAPDDHQSQKTHPSKPPQRAPRRKL